MKKSSKIKKKNQNPVSKQQILTSLLAGPVFGLALTRLQLLEKTDVVQRSLSKWWRRWRLARPASSPHQSAQGSPAPSSLLPLQYSEVPARQAGARRVELRTSVPSAAAPCPCPCPCPERAARRARGWRPPNAGPGGTWFHGAATL